MSVHCEKPESHCIASFRNLFLEIFVLLQQCHWPQHMSTCAQNSQQAGEGIVHEGDVVQQNNPQSSGGSTNNKFISSQQQQVCPVILGFRFFGCLLRSMLSGSLVTTAWHVLRLRMEEKASSYGG
jgi:hypothetical protein